MSRFSAISFAVSFAVKASISQITLKVAAKPAIFLHRTKEERPVVFRIAVLSQFPQGYYYCYTHTCSPMEGHTGRVRRVHGQNGKKKDEVEIKWTILAICRWLCMIFPLAKETYGLRKKQMRRKNNAPTILRGQSQGQGISWICFHKKKIF